MNEATNKLFELVETAKNHDKNVQYSALAERIQALTAAGADINACNESGFNVLQIILEVKAPELSLTSTIIDPHNGWDNLGYVGGKAWYVDACLRNGFQCSKENLTELLKAYVYDNYLLDGGDFRLICTLLELGADWNCKNKDDDISLLALIAGGTIQGRVDETDVTDWRYKMLCAYFNAGGDLYVKNKKGKYVWEFCRLPLTALAFFLEHSVDIGNNFESVCDDIGLSFVSVKETLNNNWILALDTYNALYAPCTVHPTEIRRYQNVINTLLDNTEKYPEISEIFIKILPGYDYIENTAEVKPDFYKPAEIYLQTLKEKYGNISKAADLVIASCQKGELGNLGQFFTFALPDYPELVDYFPWEKIDADHWEWLLEQHPELAKYRK